MARDVADDIIFLLEIAKENAGWLAPVRHWAHLSVATGEGRLWLTGLTKAEIGSAAIRSIPVKQIWRQEGSRLFKPGSLLPSRNAPALLWSPVARGLPVGRPPLNVNGFGVQGTIAVQLVPVATLREAAALLVTMDDLSLFISRAPVVRLQSLEWVMWGDGHALILGAPLLPLPGRTYWRDGSFLLPAGYDFEWPMLKGTAAVLLGKQGPGMVVWHTDNTWAYLPHALLQPLTIGSFRQSETLRKTKTQLT